MQTFEQYYNERVLEENRFTDAAANAGAVIKGKTAEFGSKISGAVSDAANTASNKLNSVVTETELGQQLTDIKRTVTEIPETLAKIGDWTVNAGIAGVGGALATNALGHVINIVANKLDAKRSDAAELASGKRNIMIQDEFQEARQSMNAVEKMSDDAKMKLLDDISMKWATKYKIPQPQMFVKLMRKTAAGLKSKWGLGFGGVLGFLAFKLAVPFPTV